MNRLSNIKILEIYWRSVEDNPLPEGEFLGLNNEDGTIDHYLKINDIIWNLNSNNITAKPEHITHWIN